MIKAVGSGAGASNVSSSNNAIEVLQAKMGDLMKKLREATQDTSPGAKERLKLLQMQIQALQTQIQQLQSAAAQKAALEQLKRQQELAAAEKRKSNDTTLGSVVDTLA
ncbi:MAG: FlxA-like family protein [Pseudomonadota bacterium]